MDAYRLPVDAAMQASPVDTGWARSIAGGPRTVQQVLADAGKAMDEQDEQERRAADPVAWLRGQRRRTLLGRLLNRR